MKEKKLKKYFSYALQVSKSFINTSTAIMNNCLTQLKNNFKGNNLSGVEKRIFFIYCIQGLNQTVEDLFIV